MGMDLNTIMSYIDNPYEYLDELGKQEDYCYKELKRQKELLKMTNEDVRIREVGEYQIRTTREKYFTDMIREIEEKRRKMVELSKAYTELNKLTRDILKELYLNMKTWECVQSELQISRTTVSRHRNKAIKEFKKVLPDIEVN